MNILKGKKALVTGASRGIGRAIALRLAQQGVHLVVTARSLEKLEELATECEKLGVNCHAVAADLAQRTSPKQIMDFVQEKFKNLDVLINNAGVGGKGTLSNGDLQRWDRCLDVNFRTIVHLSRLAFPLMEGSGWGAIVNISSISAHRPSGGAAIYSATKHALNAFSHSIFEDIRELGIKVVTICPGFVATDLVSSYGLLEEKMIQPNDIADAVEYVLKSAPTVCPVEIILRPQHSPYRD